MPEPRILTPEEISALLDYTLPIRSDVHPDDADAALFAAAPDLARTALAAMAEVERLREAIADAEASLLGDGRSEKAKRLHHYLAPLWAVLEGDSRG